MEEVERLIDKDTVDDGLAGSCAGGHVDLARRMIELGAIAFLQGFLSACANGRAGTAQLMIDHRAGNINRLLLAACRYPHINVAQVAINNGATAFSDGLRTALSHAHYHMAEFMLSKGAENIVSAERWREYEAYLAWQRCVRALPFLCEDVLRMVT